MKKVFLFVLLLSFAAQSIAEETDRLDQIRVQMEETEKELKSLRTEYDQKLADYKKGQTAVRALSEKEQALKKELGRVETSQRETQRYIAEIDGKIREIEIISQKRMKALYMMGGEEEGILNVQAKKNFDQATVYLSYVRRYDQGLVQALKELRTRRDSETGKLTKLQKKQVELLAVISAKRAELAEQVQTQKSSVDAITLKKQRLDSLLLSLKAQALRLETVLKGLTGGDDEDHGSETKKPEKSAKLLGFEGDGLPTRSFLRVPVVQPKVVQPYGRYKESGIGESFRRGVELGGQVGSVSAIDEGRVAYVGKMPQIGAVVIVDHGKRDYSLYGRLSSTSVRVGDVLNPGEEIGTTNEADNEGRVLYFEVRRQGEPVNPEDLFGKKLSGGK